MDTPEDPTETPAVKTCLVRDLGRIPYDQGVGVQRDRVARRRAGEIRDTLLLVEHEPVYTIGKVGTAEHLLADEETVRRMGAEVRETDRGGDITYHGPGQIVGYPILDLQDLKKDVKWYVERLEEVMIRTVASWGIRAGRVPGLTGAWVGDGKIGAIGVRVEGWVTSHGFALNVSTDLDAFRWIVPCGIRGKGVTSLSAELGRTVDPAEVRPRLVEIFGQVFGRDMVHEESGRP